jgi:predicted secreted protein
MAGKNAKGTQFKRGDGEAVETFTAIASVTNIQGPGLSRNTIDVTAHDSPDNHMEFIGGLIDPGEVSLDINYDPAVHDTLVADLEDEDPRNYQVVFPNGATWAIKAIMTGFEPGAPIDDKLAATAAFKVSGKPTIS